MSTTTTTTTTGDAGAVTGADLSSIVAEVWTGVLGLGLQPTQHPAPASDGRLRIGCTGLTGEWDGSVLLECGAALATAAAAAMFSAAPGDLSDDEVCDAIGELTNMVGGGVKSLMPSPTRLSLPSVARGERCTVRLPGASLVRAVDFACEAGPLRVSLWRSDRRGG